MFACGAYTRRWHGPGTVSGTVVMGVVQMLSHVHRYSRPSVGSEVTSYSSVEHSLSCPRSSMVFEPPATGSAAMCSCLSSATGL